ncbi:glycosyltransferase involved in cell wall biosynthesis [Clostridium beijerinckii]|nr:glycosyltransferase involved in cell wall biosynthesis [Clostridium beijerinckii]
MEEINSELIIVDTGSTDGTVEIAKKYTDNLYFHKWNNDFSAMRNITIDYAKGKWILIIDADEEIEDASEINFFLKSEYKNEYKSAMVSVKNITNVDSGRYGMLSSLRLFLNDGYFKYQGRVHNMPLYKTPTLSLGTVFIHYGYIETDNELMEKKFLRTSKLLIEELKKDPENIYYNYQLAASYAMHKDYDKALEQMKETYKLINDKKLDKKNYVQIYYEMSTYYYFAGDSTKYEIIQSICKEGIELEEEYIDLYFLLGKISIFINNYIQAEDNYNKYLELLGDYENLSIYKNVTLKLYTLDKVEEAYYDLAFIHYRTQNYEVCLEYLQKLNSNAYIQKAFELIVNTYIYLEKYAELKEYYNKYILDLDIDLSRTFYEHLEIAISNLNEEKAIAIMSVFSKDRNTYSFLSKVRVDFKNNKQDLGQIVNEFIEVLDFNNQPDYFGDLIYYKLKLKEEFSDLLSNISENTITRYLSYICKKYDDFCDVVQIYLNSTVHSKDNFSVIRFNKLLRKYILILNSENKEVFNINFEEYVNEGVNYINIIYNSYVIENEMIYDVKNEEDAFFIFISKANEIKNYDEKGYIRHLRKALAIYPCMKLGIEILLEELKNKTSNVNNEFEKYKKQIKNAIKDFIERNELDNAEALISEYESIVNNDIELILFKSQISIKRLKI